MVFEEMKTGYKYLSTHKNTQNTSCTIPPQHLQTPILLLFFLFCIYFFIFIFGPFSFTFPPLFHSEFSLQGASDKTPPNKIPFTLVRYSTVPVHEYLFFVLHYPELGRTAGRRDRTRLLQSRRGGRTGRVGAKGKLDEGAGQRWRQRRQ
jgi:hypothetical protein